MRQRGNVTQQRATGRTWTLGHCGKTQPLYIGCRLHQLRYRGVFISYQHCVWYCSKISYLGHLQKNEKFRLSSLEPIAANLQPSLSHNHWLKGDCTFSTVGKNNNNFTSTWRHNYWGNLHLIINTRWFVVSTLSLSGTFTRWSVAVRELINKLPLSGTCRIWPVAFLINTLLIDVLLGCP